MFTIEEIKATHAKVKSGADFPGYIQEIIQLGVISYEIFVDDGRADYFGAGRYKASAPAKYSMLVVADSSNIVQFKTALKLHQQGGTDYFTFCNDCAKHGVEKWVVDTVKMTCTYYDKAGNEMLIEIIPV